MHLVSFWDFLKLLSRHFLNLKTLPCQRECYIREGMTDKRHMRMVGWEDTERMSLLRKHWRGVSDELQWKCILEWTFV